MTVSIPTADEFDAVVVRLQAAEERISVLEEHVAALTGTTPTPVPTFRESPDAAIITPTSGSIIDAEGNIWAINAAKVLCINGYEDGATPPVLQAVYKGHQLFYEKENGAWFRWAGVGAGWLAAGNPLIAAPSPTPLPPGSAGDLAGVTARRVWDVFSGFGTNVFPNGQDGAGAQRSAAAHAAGLKLIYGSGSIMPLLRFYANSTTPAADLIAFCKAVAAAIPRAMFSGCITDMAGVPVLTAMASESAKTGYWLGQLEGFNEPDNTQNLGGGTTTPAMCLAAQQQLYTLSQQYALPLLSPSVADLTGDPQFIQNYYGSAQILAAITAASDIANAHNYPNSGSPIHELERRTTAISQVYGNKRPATSEFHPLLWNKIGDEALAAIWTVIAKITGAFDFNQQQLTWFSHWDYAGFGKPTGLFIGYDPTKLRPIGILLKSLLQIVGEATSVMFTPKKLDVVAIGLPGGINTFAGGKLRVMQRSDGVFFVAVTNDQDATAPPVPVTIRFATPKSRVLHYAMAGSTLSLLRSLMTTTTLMLQLGSPDIQILEVHP